MSGRHVRTHQSPTDSPGNPSSDAPCSRSSRSCRCRHEDRSHSRSCREPRCSSSGRPGARMSSARTTARWVSADARVSTAKRGVFIKIEMIPCETAAKREPGFLEVGKGSLSGRRTVGKGDHSAIDPRKLVSSSGRAPHSTKIIPRTRVCGIRAFIAHAAQFSQFSQLQKVFFVAGERGNETDLDAIAMTIGAK